MTKKRLLSGILTLVMLLGLLPTAALAARREEDALALDAPVTETAQRPAAPVWEDVGPQAELTEVDTTGLMNVTGQCTITTLSDTNDKPKTNLYDGNYTTLWGQNNAFPGEVTFVLPQKGEKLKTVILSFEPNKTAWGVTVTLTADGTQVDQQVVASFDDKYVYTFETAQEVSSLKVGLSNPTNDGAAGAFWPALAEAEIWVEPKPVDLSTLTNLAPKATITKNGTGTCNMDTWVDGSDETESGFYGQPLAATGDDAWVQLDLGQNYSVGGFRLAAKADNATHWYTCDVYTQRDGDTSWSLKAAGAEIRRVADRNVLLTAFPALEDVRYVKFVLHQGGNGSWGAIAELSVYGVDADDVHKDLIEVAKLSEITVPSNEGNIGNMTDGNITTLWAAGSGDWPANVDFALPGNLLIQRVEVDFERFNGRTFDLTVSRAVNNVTSDYQQLDTKDGHDVNETYVLALDEAQRMTHVRVALDGTNGQAWPAIAEVRIYAVNETIDLNNYTDITEHATQSSGVNYKDWDFRSNQQVVGFRATLAEGASAVVKGKMKRDTSWTTYVAQLQSGDNVLSFPAGMSAVRVELTDPSQLTAFQIFGTYSEAAVDSGSVAFDKPAHGNFNAATTYLVNDGDKNTGWQADMYPAYVDIDLAGNYDVTEIQVFTPAAGYTEYTLYTSIDGQNYDLVASKLDNAACPADGDVHTLSTAKTARYVRVYLEYYSQNAKPTLNEVRVIGAESADQTDHTVTFADVTAFADSSYAAPITQQDTIDEVKGIIRRQVGAAYVDWFTFALANDPDGYDYFTLEDEGGKIKVTGNNGVSLATGVNHYLKYFCNVHISQVGNQVKMPAAVVPVGTAVHKETKYHTRYAYNYCTHSYSMAFWGEDEWRNELDWLALNGVNLVLDITGQEEVWREFLMDVGFSHQEAKDFLAGPGYYAWAYMANLTGFGGPIHDSYLTNQVEQGRKNQRTMRVLGMEPVLQAFSGMVPVEIATKDPGAAVIPQGAWCSFQRPTMLKTDTATYDEYAAKFYAAQKRVFGDAKYYATDPFHEGGNTGGMSTTVVASELLDSLLAADSDAVWVIQSWQGNPSSGLLAGLRAGTNPTRADRREHALVLDLYAERTPHNNEYGEDTDGDGVKEFSDTPWVWCQLNNFGGRMGLHGYLDNLQKNIPATANRSKHMAGIGISPEGSQENPVLYDFLFETIWTADASQPLPVIDLDQWLADYVTRRYGAVSENAQAAMDILADTVYNSNKSGVAQGAPESVVNARPAKSISAASTWGYSYIYYDKTRLQEAAQLLLADYDTLSDSDAYLYDLADVLKQVLSNTAQYLHGKMVSAYNSKDAEEFTALSDQFLALIDLSDQVMGTRKEFLFGTWTTNASELAAGADDFTQRLYLRNAKALVTTWGAIQQCETGGLKDYSNRQWSGLTKDFYKVRWQTWIDQAKANLAAGNANNISISWFPWEWKFARNTDAYSNTPNGLSLQTLGQKVLDDFSIVTPPEAMDTYDLAVSAAKAGSSQSGEDADKALDGNSGTLWHTQYSGGVRADMWIALDLGYARMVDGLRYLPRQEGSNGKITEYKLLVSSSDTDWAGTTDTWREVASGTWNTTSDWKKASFTATSARYVKLVAVASEGNFASAAEIRVTNTPIPVEDITLDRTEATLYLNDGSPTLTLTATITPSDATNKAVSWSTDRADVATVNNGVVTAVSVGSAVITATAEDGAFTASCNLSVKAKLTGEVHITGSGKFGSVLTASLNQLSPAGAKDHPTYQWYRDGSPISDAEAARYTVVKEDIGHQITVKVTATDPYEGSVTSEAVTGVKADGPAMLATPTHRNVSATGQSDGAITGLFKGRKYQYFLWDRTELPGEDADWVDFCDNSATETPVEGQTHGTAEITGLGVGSYIVRRAGDDTHDPGPFSNTVTISVEGAVEYALTNPHTFAGGEVQAGRTQIPADDTVTLWVTPSQGYLLVSGSLKAVEADGTEHVAAATDREGVYTFIMPAADVTITASFTRKTYTLEHQLTHISCSMAQHNHTVIHGDTPTITLQADSGYVLPDSITITKKNGGEEIFTYTYRDGLIRFTEGITEDLVITGAGVKEVYTVDYTRLVHLTAEGPATVEHGAALTVTLSPAEGYSLPTEVYISVGSGVLHDFTYDPFTGVVSIPENVITGNVTITAEGKTKPIIEPFTLSASPTSLSGGGAVRLTVTVPEERFQEVADDNILLNPAPTVLVVTCSDASVQLQPASYRPSRHTVTFTATLPNATKTYTFTATLAANEAAGFPADTADCTVSVTKTGGSGGGNSGGGSPAPTEPPKTETLEDGTKVTTVTKPDGTVTETAEKPDGTVEVVETKKDGTVTETVTAPDGAQTEKITTPDQEVTITVTDAEGEELAKVELPATIPAPETRFDDVPEGHWADKAIHNAAALELVKGVGDNKFDMVAPMSRGSLATVLHRLSQGKTDYETTFQDVAAGKFYTEGVAWAAKAGVVTGYTEDTFAPEDVITREQLAVMLARYAKLIGMDTKADAKALEAFADGEATGSWAVDGMAWCVDKGILQGKGGNVLDPTTNVTRAEVAVMLDRFIALMK